MTDGEDLPGPRSVLDVHVPDRDDLLISFVPEEQPDDGVLVVTVAQDRTGRRIRVPVGDTVELIWSSRRGPRARSARVVEVVTTGEPVWRLEPLGTVRDGQRRGAVRAEVGLPVTLVDGSRTAAGTSLDLSETGVRGRWPLESGWPAVGDEVVLTVVLSEARTLTGPARVRRAYPTTDGRVEASLEFVGWPEKAQDQLRGRVFERLRQLARRGDL
ncbi:c-di-GMP-binding flagellar brake protein YcgR, contains PilZNR and PilZ domains [Klenkia marina]|uniref:C-di-GMP-binding flagellar brake protein YcgR, contains PilZNR and PilZ domains n=1 Tax=Klenkia marina TaxID=1960309 RepID=A0A1G4YZ37_9ACTN|nr:PilZ domain-containing protein [Klenkia marina]SCX58702.1 c-di-GMP-binding flagellar brake protein YcgR, contains PilZNR and PilZ domains [Klenkia marina]